MSNLEWELTESKRREAELRLEKIALEDNVGAYFRVNEGLKTRVKTLEDAIDALPHFGGAHSTASWCSTCLLKQALAAKEPKALLKTASDKPAEGCHCSPGNCMAPVVMGFQVPCRDPRKAAGETK